MKKFMVICLAIMVFIAGANMVMVFPACAVESGPSVQLDFTAMAVATNIPKENLGAVDASTNYQIGPEDGANMLYTIGGYTPTWMTWKLEAPEGKKFSSANLQIIGKICDYAENENLFGVFVYDEQPDGASLANNSGEAVHFEDAKNKTMPNSGSYTDVHNFDLSAKVSGKTTVYITVYQMTTGSPGWIGDRSLSITSQFEGVSAPSLVIAEDGSSIAVDFTAMAIATNIPKEDLGAVDASTNYQIGLQDGANTLYTVGGYTPTWMTWKLEAPEGKQIKSANLRIIGKICDYAENENLFGVFVYDEQPDGASLANNSEEAVHFENAYNETMPNSGSYTDVHNFDLSAKASGKTTVYVTVYQMTTGCPEWIGYRSLTLTADFEDFQEAGSSEETDSSEEADSSEETDSSEEVDSSEESNQAGEPKDENPSTGSSLPMLPILISSGLISVMMLKGKKKKL